MIGYDNSTPLNHDIQDTPKSEDTSKISSPQEIIKISRSAASKYFREWRGADASHALCSVVCLFVCYQFFLQLSYVVGSGIASWGVRNPPRKGGKLCWVIVEKPCYIVLMSSVLWELTASLEIFSVGLWFSMFFWEDLVQ